MIEFAIRHAFRGFTLDVRCKARGPVVGVFGPSGSGKSTLLLALAGLLRPQRAQIEVGGRTLCARPGGVWVPPGRRRLAVVLQEPLLFPHLSARGNLGYAPGAKRALATEHGQQLIEVLRLAPLLDQAPATLSGGERQRVALGRALLSAPELLLLDEPTAALDAELARDILGLLREVRDRLGTRMLFVTHKADELLALADECLVLHQGEITAQGAPIEVLARPRALGVANLVGVDNLLRLPLLRHDASGGVSLLQLGGGVELAAPYCEQPPGTPVAVGLYADEVILCLARPRGISARNVLPGSVVGCDPIGREVLVRVLVGDTELLCRVTPSAVRELGLTPGLAVFAVVKTTSCHLLGRDAYGA